MVWNKGYTKHTHPSVAKISKTFSSMKIDNFAKWRFQMKLEGKIPSDYPVLNKNADLAELIGVILGDGHIEVFPRTERLLIVGDSKKMGFINHYAVLVEKVFNKKPSINYVKASNTVRISLYQKNISQRLGIKSGNRSGYAYEIPAWIRYNTANLIGFLKGLFEAEGSLSIHLPTYTYNFQFTNMNPYLLAIVRDSLISLGYHPEVRAIYIRLRKKVEVASFKELIHFRDYTAG